MNSSTKWLERNILVINLALALTSLVSYVGTMYLLAYQTDLRWPEGSLGGLVNYNFLRTINVYHITNNNPQPIFSFPDTTSYLLAALIIIDLAVLASRRDADADRPDWNRIRNITVGNIIAGIVALLTYVWTMMYIDSHLRQFQPLAAGGIVQYNFSYMIWTVATIDGGTVSSLKSSTTDFAFWLLLLLLVLTTVRLARKPKRTISV